MVDQFATVQLNIEKSEAMPPRGGIYQLLKRWGLTNQTQECFWVIAYDGVMNIRTCVEINRGGYASVDVHMPAMFTAVLTAGADRFQVAHNHPNGDVRPSVKDVQLTQAIMAGANQLGLWFEDHHIVGPNGQYYSFTESKLMVPAPYTGVKSA